MYNRGGTDYANRATNQMQGAAGTLASMTKKQEVKVKRPDTTFGDIVTQGIGLTMLGNEMSEWDWVNSLFKDDPASKGAQVADQSGGAPTPSTSPVTDVLFGEKTVAPDVVASNGQAPAMGAPETVMASPPLTQPKVMPQAMGAHPSATPGGPMQTSMGVPTPAAPTTMHTVVAGPTPVATTPTPVVMAETVAPNALEAMPTVTAGTDVQSASGALVAEGLGGVASTTGGASLAGAGGTLAPGAVESAFSTIGGGLINGAAGATTATGTATGVEGALAGVGTELTAGMAPVGVGVAEAASAAPAATGMGPAGWIVGGAIGLGAIGAFLFS